MDLAELTKTISAATAAGRPTDTKEEDRQALLAACSKLTSSLESPLDLVQRILFGV